MFLQSRIERRRTRNKTGRTQIYTPNVRTEEPVSCNLGVGEVHRCPLRDCGILTALQRSTSGRRSGHSRTDQIFDSPIHPELCIGRNVQAVSTEVSPARRIPPSTPLPTPYQPLREIVLMYSSYRTETHRILDTVIRWMYRYACCTYVVEVESRKSNSRVFHDPPGFRKCAFGLFV